MTRHELLLAQVAEECAEIGKRAVKALRFGMEQTQPGQELTNHERIRQEFCDLVAVMDMVDPALTAFSGMEYGAKQAKVERYLAFSLGEAPHP